MIGYEMTTYLSFCHRRQVRQKVDVKFRGLDARTAKFHVWCKDLYVLNKHVCAVVVKCEKAHEFSHSLWESSWALSRSTTRLKSFLITVYNQEQHHELRCGAKNGRWRF